jgi:hypothetical protein
MPPVQNSDLRQPVRPKYWNALLHRNLSADDDQTTRRFADARIKRAYYVTPAVTGRRHHEYSTARAEERK